MVLYCCVGLQLWSNVVSVVDVYSVLLCGVVLAVWLMCNIQYDSILLCGVAVMG